MARFLPTPSYGARDEHVFACDPAYGPSCRFASELQYCDTTWCTNKTPGARFGSQRYPRSCDSSGGLEGLPLDFDDAEFYRHFDRFSTSQRQMREVRTRPGRHCAQCCAQQLLRPLGGVHSYTAQGFERCGTRYVFPARCTKCSVSAMKSGFLEQYHMHKHHVPPRQTGEGN